MLLRPQVRCQRVEASTNPFMRDCVLAMRMGGEAFYDDSDAAAWTLAPSSDVHFWSVPPSQALGGAHLDRDV